MFSSNRCESPFLAAVLSLLFLDQRIEVQHGLYGDFVGNRGRLASTEAYGGIVLMEWTDLDPRLGCMGQPEQRRQPVLNAKLGDDRA